MPTKVAHLYRVPILLSITLGIVLVALKVEREVLNIVLIFVGAVLGSFALDFDYIIHAYFVDPTSEFSQMVTSYIKHRDIKGAFAYISHHRNDVNETTLNSGLFQVVLVGLTFFALSSNINIALKALVISTFLNSIYRFLEYFMHGRVNEWFWSLRVNTNRGAMYLYTGLLLVSLIYALFLF